MEVSRSADSDASAANNGNFWNDPPGTDTVEAILSLGNAPAKERSSHSTATLGGNGNPGDPASVPGLALSSQGQETGVALEDLCPVCGDRVSGYHYGLQTCESCKGFFKRTVQNGKVYLCIEKQQCVITKAQRKRCPYCRFQKCLSVGMKLEAVRADRMRGGRNKFGPLYKYDRAVKQQALQQRQQMLSNRLFGPSGTSDRYDSGMEMPPVPSTTPPDVKPDINLLSSYVAGDCSQPDHDHFLPHMARSILPHAKPFSEAVLNSTPGGSCQVAFPLYQTVGSSPLASYAPTTGFQLCFPEANRSGHATTSPTSAATNPLAGMAHMMSEINSSLSPPVPSSNAFHFQGHRYSQQQQQQQQQQLQHPIETWPELHPDSLQLPTQYRNVATYSDDVYSACDNRWYNQTHCLPPFGGISASTHPTLPTTSSFCAPSQQPFAPPAIPLRSTVLSFPAIPPLIKELQRNELSKSEILQKLGTLVDSLLTQYSNLRSEMEEVTMQSSDLSANNGSGCLRLMLQIFCQLCDRSLFMLVEWARGAHLFKELKVDCQMRLLQGSWSELLIFNVVYQQTRHQQFDELLVATGHTVSIGLLLKLGLQVVVQHLTELIRKVRELALDPNEYSCLKFIILLNPDISGLSCRELVEQLQERVNTALLEYCSVVDNQANDRFGQLLMLLHDVRLVSLHGEDFFYAQHLNGNILENTLLVEMLHSRQA